ncbi:outer membrane beta-barrel protein [Vibrio parahaemolyticus]|nr:porin family protein [Vibrio parahaemolyticus]EGR5928535.1 porin family protein [Vibrio parahaemolyticus]EHU5130714.1 outer membrane beta-barrel protein [Vibrio parahaemolyticus]EHZ2573911.1 outer membrane beta-barrel protein [Vibrio parahaemolyticus]EIU7850760.1 outer membrane beta-barrel protein [Vibrio parahaemolyticus]
MANVFTIVIFIYKFIAGIYLVHYFYIAVCSLINMDVIMKKGNVLLAILALSFTGVSQGKQYNNVSEFEPFGYLGIGYQYADADINLGSLGSYSLNNSLFGAMFGYRFHQNFGVEVRGYGSVSDDELYGISLEVERNFALLAKGLVPLGENVDLYGLLGYGKITASADGASESDEDLQYGIGFAFNKGTPLELQIEWMKLYDDNGLDLSGINLNIVYRL